jgi:hypothetical protein
MNYFLTKDYDELFFYNIKCYIKSIYLLHLLSCLAIKNFIISYISLTQLVVTLHYIHMKIGFESCPSHLSTLEHLKRWYHFGYHISLQVVSIMSCNTYATYIYFVSMVILMWVSYIISKWYIIFNLIYKKM